ncbi:hypothetical protein [Bradyrhizobium sp. URHD0069]|nr:hypothetical protein [Bradyrhizobium sp. URHD0069]
MLKATSHGPTGSVNCNLYSISTDQAAIILRLWELARDIDCEGRH